jgi:hypothetical protein
MKYKHSAEFDRKFNEHMSVGMTRFEAYDATERLHRKLHNGERCFQSFKSFDNSWYKRRKKKDF